MRRSFHALALASLLLAPEPASEAHAEGIEDRIELRPLDRATVRILTVSGADSYLFDGDDTRVRRVVAMPNAGHGSGVLVDAAGLVLTAGHVVWGSDVIAVLLPGTDEPRPATILYVDPVHDLAVLHVAVPDATVLAVPRTTRRFRVSERLFGTGYPVDVRERYPAAFTGVLSRENNDGSIQVSMSLNAGNSGGPIVDDAGQLVGIVSRKASTRHGLEGMAFLEPLRFVIPALEAARAILSAQTPTYTTNDAVLCRIVADFIQTTDERPLFEQTAIPTLEAAASSASTPEATMIVAAHAWNMHVALLERRRVRDVAQLPANDRPLGERLSNMARTLARRAVSDAPYLLVRYPIVRGILVSEDRSYVLREGGRS